MDELRLRPYQLRDAEKIVTWCEGEEAFYKWSAGILGQYPLTAERFNKTMAARDNAGHYFPFVVEENGSPVGFFILRQSGEEPQELRFGFVIVSPDVRGKGYGKKMLELGIRYALELYHAKKVSLGVFANNPGAYHCYRALGFRENGRVSHCQIGENVWKCVELELEAEDNDH